MPVGLSVLWPAPLGLQSLIAELSPGKALPGAVRVAADGPLGLVLPEPVVVPLESGFEAMLPRLQSVLLLPKVREFDESGLALGLALLAPPVLFCAIAAVPSVNATIEAAVRISRCILVSSC